MYKVIKNFVDRETMRHQEINSEYTPSSKKRADELIKKGVIEAIDKTPSKRKASKKGADKNESSKTK